MKKIYIPYLSEHAYIVCAAFKHFGVPAQVMDSTKESLNLSKLYLSGKECLPCSTIAGDMIKTIKSTDFDPKRAVFYTPFHQNYCRYGQYNKLQRIVLEELGYSDIPSYDVNLNKKTDLLNIKNKSFLSAIFWEGLIVIDCLNSWLYKNRPYAKDKKLIEDTHNKAISKLCWQIENCGNVIPVLKEITRILDSCTVVQKKQRPVIGVVGEVYTRLNKFSNSNLISILEDLGLECRVAPLFLMDNWFKYSRLVYRRKWYSHIDAKIKDCFQEKMARKILKYFKHLINKESFTSSLRKKAKSHFNLYIKEDEILIIIGKAIDFINQGVNGIIEVMPYNCMFGTIAFTIMQKICEDYNIPFLCLHFDGLKQTNIINRLEAFVYQVERSM